MMKTYIIIPAFNEEKRIQTTITDILSHGYKNIIVVDDGSKDSTHEIARRYPVKVLRHMINRGMGAALATGTNYALSEGADIIVHFDADGQHRASDISNVIEPIISHHVDIVLGSRYLKKNIMPMTKKYLIHMPALLFQNILTGVYLSDVHNGFRALSKNAAKRINIEQDRMAHNTEIVEQIKKNGLRYAEVPVTILYHEYGQSFMDGTKILWDLIMKKIFK